MSIRADVKSGQCKICLQGVTNFIPVLEMVHTTGMRVWEVSVCKKCAAELRQHLDEFLEPDNS
jgi:hypothetical protein